MITRPPVLKKCIVLAAEEAVQKKQRIKNGLEVRFNLYSLGIFPYSLSTLALTDDITYTNNLGFLTQ